MIGFGKKEEKERKKRRRRCHTGIDVVKGIDNTSEGSKEDLIVEVLGVHPYTVRMRLDIHRWVHLEHSLGGSLTLELLLTHETTNDACERWERIGERETESMYVCMCACVLVCTETS